MTKLLIEESLLRQVLDALEKAQNDDDYIYTNEVILDGTITALRAAIEQQEQEKCWYCGKDTKHCTHPTPAVEKEQDMNFDELALKVFEDLNNDDTCLPVRASDYAIAYARRLREEWVKSLEPVAWRYIPKQGLGWDWQYTKSRPVDEVNYMTEPLYTLEELTK